MTNKPGRPKKAQKDRRDSIIQVRVNDGEMFQYSKLCGDTPLSVWLRSLADAQAAVISGSIPAAMVEAVAERANASGSTVSAIVEAAIAAWLDSGDARAERHANETGQTVAEIRTAAIAEYLAKRGI